MLKEVFMHLAHIPDVFFFDPQVPFDGLNFLWPLEEPHSIRRRPQQSLRGDASKRKPAYPSLGRIRTSVGNLCRSFDKSRSNPRGFLIRASGSYTKQNSALQSPCT